jgi:hypothetical protein
MAVRNACSETDPSAVIVLKCNVTWLTFPPPGGSCSRQGSHTLLIVDAALNGPVELRID